ncbi:alpha/beta hydrolase [Psychromarinibacter halotolerans]|uniref:Alpha/beta hydrolase n=1 Tax=Psychromarinibacter halotolerans TaxID=1775175 RepID=A0ABV7H0H5_9RHOB|nr:alpha/beta hydrolase [Psychromarinibacter halotolerans]MDF0596290.1 alpha/beta hydrolase [Psychromarinibacter halotolerans]
MPLEPLDPAAMEMAYNNQLAVPDHYRYSQAWLDNATFVRKHMAAAVDLAYGPGPRERLDIFPSPVPNAPVLVFIHGGWFQFLDKSSLSFVAAPYVQAGITVVAISYPLTPDARMPEIVRAARRALLWVHANIADHGGDPARISVAGHSAGGHLALSLGFRDWTADAGQPDLVKGCFPISGLYDLRPVMGTIYNAKIGLDAETALEWSPLERFERAPSHLLAIVGGDEISGFQWQHRALMDFCAEQEINAAEHSAPGRNHYSVVDEFATAKGALFGKVAGAIQFL